MDIFEKLNGDITNYTNARRRKCSAQRRVIRIADGAVSSDEKVKMIEN